MNDTAFGRTLRDLRMSRKWTQSMVAAKIGDGIQSSLYAKYERGEVRPERKRIADIAKAFDISPALLLTALDLDTLTPEALAASFMAYADSLPFLRRSTKNKFRTMLAVDVADYVAEHPTLPAPTSYPRIRPIAAAGDPTDIDLPENQRILRELNDEEDDDEG